MSFKNGGEFGSGSCTVSGLMSLDMIGEWYDTTQTVWYENEAKYLTLSANSSSYSESTSVSSSNSKVRFSAEIRDGQVYTEFSPIVEFEDASYNFYVWGPVSGMGSNATRKYITYTVNLHATRQYDHKVDYYVEYTDLNGSTATRFFTTVDYGRTTDPAKTINVGRFETLDGDVRGWIRGFTPTGDTFRYNTWTYSLGTQITISEGTTRMYVSATEHSYTLILKNTRIQPETEYGRVQLRYTQSYTLPTLDTVSPYTFKGWGTSTTSTATISNTLYEKVSEDGGTYTLYTVWVPEKYILTYVMHGGAQDTAEVCAGASVALPNAPQYRSAEGDCTVSPYWQTNLTYVNDTWCSDEECEEAVGEVSSTYTPSGNNAYITLYAHYSIQDSSTNYTYGYIIEYNTQGGTSVTRTVLTQTSSTKVDTLVYNNALLSASAPAYTNHTFLGWNLNSTADSGGYTANLPNYGVTTVYAIWKLNLESIDITYDPATRKFTASLTPSTATVDLVWVSATTSVATISQAGEVALKTNGSSEIYARTEDGAVFSNRQTLYVTGAEYNPNYSNGTSITDYKSNVTGESESFPITDSIHTPTYPTELDSAKGIGYNFLGWTTTAQSAPTERQDLYTKDNSDSIQVSAGAKATAYAAWGRYTHKIKYDTNAPSDASVTAGWESSTVTSKSDTVTIPLTSTSPRSDEADLGPKNDKYHFAGWTTLRQGPSTGSYTGEVVSGDQTVQILLTLYAVWERFLHKCTYKSADGAEELGTEKSYYDAVENKCQFTISVNDLGESEDNTFGGWGVNNVIYQKGDIIALNTQDAVLYASWDPIYLLTVVNSSFKPTGLGAEDYSVTTDTHTYKLRLNNGKYSYGEIPVIQEEYKYFGDALDAESSYCRARFKREFKEWIKAPGDPVKITTESGKYVITLNNLGDTRIEAGYTMSTSWQYGLSVEYDKNTRSVEPGASIKREYSPIGVANPASVSQVSEFGTVGPDDSNKPRFTVRLPGVLNGWENHTCTGWTDSSHFDGTDNVHQYFTNDFTSTDVKSGATNVELGPGEVRYYAVWQTSPTAELRVQSYESLPDSVTGWTNGIKSLYNGTLYCGQSASISVPDDTPGRSGYEFKGWGYLGALYAGESTSAFIKYQGNTRLTIYSENVGSEYAIYLYAEWAILRYYRAVYHRSEDTSDWFETVISTTAETSQLFYPTRVAEANKYSSNRPSDNYIHVGWSRFDGHDSGGNYSLETSEEGVAWGQSYTYGATEATISANSLHFYAAYSPKHTLCIKYASRKTNNEYTYFEEYQTSKVIGEYYDDNNVKMVFFPSEADSTTTVWKLTDNLTSQIPTFTDAVFLGWHDERTTNVGYYSGNTVSATTTSISPQVLTVTFLVVTSEYCRVYLYLCSPGLNESGQTVYTTTEYLDTYSIKFNQMYVWDHVSDLDSNNMQCVSKVYIGNEYSANKSGLESGIVNGERTIGYEKSTDKLYFKPVPADTARVNLLLEYHPSTYKIIVYPGKNSGATTTQYEYKRTYTLGEKAGDTLDLTDFAGTGDEYERLLRGSSDNTGDFQYSFSGYSYSLDGDITYRAGDLPTYNGFKNSAGAYPKNGETVYFYAQWGKYVTQVTLVDTQTGSNWASWSFQTGPNDAGNQVVRIYDSTSGEYISSGTGWTSEYILNGDMTTITVTFSTAGKYSFKFRPIGVSPATLEENWPIITRTATYTRLEFNNDNPGKSVLLPRAVEMVEEDGESSMTVPLDGMIAVSNDSDYIFGGWVSNVFHTTPLDSVICEGGSYTVLYPLWEVTALYVLNGGYWVDGDDHDFHGYCTYSNKDSAPKLTLPSSSVLAHKTKKFNGWGKGNSGAEVQLTPGVTIIHAKWTMKNLEWYWGKVSTTTVGPIEITKGDMTYPYIHTSLGVDWNTAKDTNVFAFNTDENMPSHINRVTYPSENWCTVKLVDKTSWSNESGGTVYWTKSYNIPNGGKIYINELEFPKTLSKLKNGAISYDANDLAVGPIYQISTGKDGTPVWTRMTAVESVYVISAVAGSTIILGVDRSPSDTYAPITIYTDLDLGCRAYDLNTDSNSGNWLIISNKTAHKVNMLLTDKLYSAETYIIETELDSERCFFRRIYENWITATPGSTGFVPKKVDETWTNIAAYGALSTSVRADAGCYAVIFTAHVGAVERKYVLLVKIEDKVPDAPICKLTKYESANSRPEVFYLSSPSQPNLSITAMSKSMKAQLNQSPILTKSSQFNYIIDLGNTETYSFSVTRTPPANPVDQVNGDPSKWSNMYWMTRLKEYFDQWQNANYNSIHKRSGGYNLVFDPVVDYNGFPKIDKNVFLSSALSYTYDRALVNLNFKFTVASMLGREASEITSDSKEVYFYYWPSSVSIDNRTNDNRVKITVKYYNSVYVVPDIPSDATGMIAWKGMTSQSTEIIVYPGDEVPYNSIMSMNEYTAFYGTLSKVLVCDQAMADKVFDPSRDFGTNDNLNLSTKKVWATCTAIGGGGGGGESKADLQVFIPDFNNTMDAVFVTNYFLGGGGGSGKSSSSSVQLAENMVFDISVGAGGGSGTSGGGSSVSVSNTLVANAAGGGAGGLKSNGDGGNKGGEQSNATGLLNAIHWGNGKIKGSNGYPNANVTSGSTLRGGSGVSDKDGTPGSGGGSAKLLKDYSVYSNVSVYRLTKSGITKYVTNPRIESVGASTKADTRGSIAIPENTARYGGGGCSYLEAPSLSTISYNIDALMNVVKANSNTVNKIWNGVNTIMDAVAGYRDDGWEGVMNAILGVDEDEAIIQISNDGKAGADGVVIIEFYTVGDD